MADWAGFRESPEHGGEGHSGNSLHINESTGQYKCHGGCVVILRLCMLLLLPGS